MRRATKYNCIFFDKEPFKISRKKFDYLNHSNLEVYANMLKNKGFKFD